MAENQSKPKLKIGQLARRVNVNVRTLRYYETLGLLAAPQRTETGYRLYSEADERRLRFVLQAKRVGLSLEEIGTVIDLYFEDPTGVTAKRRVLAILEGHLRETEGKLSALEQFRDDLRTNIERMEGFIKAGPKE